MKLVAGIFFEKRNGEWIETNNWPKGRSSARISATRNGETAMVSASMSVSEARKKVAEFISAELNKDHGYERFAIVPQMAVEMDEAAKSRLRKARDLKKLPAIEETVEALAAEAFIRDEKKRKSAERKSYDRRTD